MIGACSHCETERPLNGRHCSYFNSQSDKEVQKCRSIYWLDTLEANHSFQNSTADHFKPDTSAPSEKTWFTTQSNVLRYEWRFHSLNERRAGMPKMSKNKNPNALVKRFNEFPTTRLTPLRISKLRKGSHLTTPFLEAKDGEQGARAAYPKANPATKALQY